MNKTLKSFLNAINSSLEVFLGIEKNPNLRDSNAQNATANNIEYLHTRDYSFDMTTINTDTQTSQQWLGQKVALSAMEVAYSTLGLNGANPFTFNA